ncbi:MAG: hypothetical protein Q7T56_03610 [Nocardioidaceae bacterium]|nr:hypothetical protein [Nocardioidaceae bacterium]
MNPERFLGRDPAVGDLVTVDRTTVALREVVLVLAEGRGRLDSTVVDSVWRGARGAVVVDAVSDLRARLDLVEGAVAEFTAVWQEWRHGLARRQDRTAELAETMSQLGGEGDAEGRRAGVERQVDELEAEHLVAADSLARAAEALTEALAPAGDETDVAADLRAGVGALDGAVHAWMQASGDRTRTSAASAVGVASLTGVLPLMYGVGDEEADPQARETAAGAPGAHRLLDALDHRGEAAEPELADATFAPAPSRGPSLADRLRGAPAAADETDAGDAS